MEWTNAAVAAFFHRLASNLVSQSNHQTGILD